MGCNGCDVSCVLISTDCLCKRTPLSGIDPLEYSSIIVVINSIIEEQIGEDCFDILCELKLSQSEDFKNYYAYLFYLYWLEENGSGQFSKEGIIRKSSDEYSDYNVINTKELSHKIQGIKAIVERFKAKWVKSFTKEYPECKKSKNCDCGKSQCGCKDKCNNNIKKENNYNKCNNKKNCGCNSCSIYNEMQAI